MKPKNIVIGVYNEDHNLVGYKADTFWTLTAFKGYAKKHSSIEPTYISNLQSILEFSDSSHELEGLFEHSKSQFKKDRKYFIGYESIFSDKVVLTHQIQNDIIQELE